ncbi:hypothetical protein [Nocardioides solisilvae]|uniref:phosphatase domain-containing protein n=1 Tax=Nocardioides solisilvae TaxID=1542435 RepID=UPI000D74F494|nr:hypothetical protein [Nocardioides solisilvae]
MPAPRQQPAPGRQVAVVDIDGVLADVRHRLHHVRESPKDWGAFFAAARHDPPLAEGLEVVRRLAEVYGIVYLSGRPEQCRRDTEEWFRRHGLPEGELRLRPARDRRPARVLKVAELRRIARDAEVVVHVDDDPEVVAASRAAGFDVLPATWMPEDRDDAVALRRAQEEDGRS